MSRRPQRRFRLAETSACPAPACVPLAARTSPCDSQRYNALKVRDSATVREEPEVEVALVNHYAPVTGSQDCGQGSSSDILVSWRPAYDEVFT